MITTVALIVMIALSIVLMLCGVAVTLIVVGYYAYLALELVLLLWDIVVGFYEQITAPAPGGG